MLEGDRQGTSDKVAAAIEQGIELARVLNDGMVTAMGRVGSLFEEGEFFVPEMLISARAMQESMRVLKPHLVEAHVAAQGKVVIGTVKGDLHDIGKNLVAMMLEVAAFEIVDLGTNVILDRLVEAVRDLQPDLMAMSALLTTTMPNMRFTLDALTAAGVWTDVKVLVGGAPITQQYATTIGADGYASDARRAVSLAKDLIGRD